MSTSLSKSTKWAIIGKYLLGNILNQLLGFRSLSIFNLTINSFDWATVFWLFGEVFLRSEYFFTTTKTTPVIIDCGANTGMTTLYHKRLYPQSTLYSFEPNKLAFSILQKNILQNKLENVLLFQQAVADYEGTIDFYDTEDPSFTTWTIAGRSWNYNKTSVECIRFSEFIKDKHIDLLKMDIEGWEDPVLFDLEKTNGFANITEIILEYHHNIENNKSNLPSILAMLQNAWYTYSINAIAFKPYQTHNFQDLLIHAKKS
jgi:FkbM family methyltransferase